MTPPDSGEREVDRLNRIAVQQCVEEQRKLAKMSPAERARYINDWAARLGPQLAEAGTAHDREMSAPWISLPLPLAQRILAALEDSIRSHEPCIPDACWCIDARALADELRAVIGK